MLRLPSNRPCAVGEEDEEFELDEEEEALNSEEAAMWLVVDVFEKERGGSGVLVMLEEEMSED